MNPQQRIEIIDWSQEEINNFLNHVEHVANPQSSVQKVLCDVTTHNSHKRMKDAMVITQWYIYMRGHNQQLNYETWTMFRNDALNGRITVYTTNAEFSSHYNIRNTWEQFLYEQLGVQVAGNIQQIPMNTQIQMNTQMMEPMDQTQGYPYIQQMSQQTQYIQQQMPQTQMQGVPQSQQPQMVMNCDLSGQSISSEHQYGQGMQIQQPTNMAMGTIPQQQQQPTNVPMGTIQQQQVPMQPNRGNIIYIGNVQNPYFIQMPMPHYVTQQQMNAQMNMPMNGIQGIPMTVAVPLDQQQQMNYGEQQQYAQEQVEENAEYIDGNMTPNLLYIPQNGEVNGYSNYGSSDSVYQTPPSGN